MWTSLYETIADRIYWYLCFSEEKGQLESDLAHAKECYADLKKDPFDDEATQEGLMKTLQNVIDVFTMRINELQNGVAPQLGGEGCRYAEMFSGKRNPFT